MHHLRLEGLSSWPASSLPRLGTQDKQSRQVVDGLVVRGVATGIICVSLAVKWHCTKFRVAGLLDNRSGCCLWCAFERGTITHLLPPFVCFWGRNVRSFRYTSPSLILCEHVWTQFEHSVHIWTQFEHSVHVWTRFEHSLCSRLNTVWTQFFNCENSVQTVFKREHSVFALNTECLNCVQWLSSRALVE